MYECDICNELIDPSEIYHIKVKSLRFINYVNYDTIGANKKTIDICSSCIDNFKKFIMNNE